jgi:hypothetical protein
VEHLCAYTWGGGGSVLMDTSPLSVGLVSFVILGPYQPTCCIPPLCHIQSIKCRVGCNFLGFIVTIISPYVRSVEISGSPNVEVRLGIVKRRRAACVEVWQVDVQKGGIIN